MSNLRLCTTKENQFGDMRIVKLPHKEISKKTKTRMVVESLVDQFLESGLISNERLFNQILYNKEIIWIQNEGYNGHLFAKASEAEVYYNARHHLRVQTRDRNHKKRDCYFLY